MLKRIGKKVSKQKHVDLIAVTITAELSDAYRTKREGVSQILNQINRAFPRTQTLVASVDGKLLTSQQAKAETAKVAAANWAATGWLISQVRKNCIVIDVGSTTTSIIPIVNGAVVAEGKTDLEKLACGELVYTGSLRTNIAAIVNTVPVRGCATRVSSELFAQSADVHLILGNIFEEDYAVETADGKDKTKEASLARLARVVCADTEMLTEKDIILIAKHVYAKQIEQIANGIAQVYGHLTQSGAEDVAVVVTGLGRSFLARKAAWEAGFPEAIDLGELSGSDIARVSTAFAVALMGASRVEGGFVRWMP